MKANHQVQRRTIAIKQKPVRHSEQREDPELTPSQKLAIAQMLVERIYIPILNGSVPMREVITPAVGWKSLEAACPI